MPRDSKIIGLLFIMTVVFAGMIVSLPSDAGVTGPCDETVTQYCKEVTPGGGRILKCLNDHEDDQSISCKDWIEDQNKSLHELNAACTKEIVAVCNFPSAPDNLRIFRCLEGHYQGLSMDCRTKLREIKDRLQ
jgi:hypothetical protein